jgi:hypothetical protein
MPWAPVVAFACSSEARSVRRGPSFESLVAAPVAHADAIDGCMTVEPGELWFVDRP